MSIPAELKYSKSHEWIRIEGDEAVVGITHFAQDALGDITYVDFPAVGDAFDVDEEFGSIESVKAASELYAPVKGEVVAVNEAINDAPETVNSAPYTDGWLVRIKLDGAPEGLMDAAAYEALCADEAH